MLSHKLLKFLHKLHILPKSLCDKHKTQLTKEYCKIASSKFFDKKWYLAQNPDVKASGFDPVLHYLETGWREGRDPSGHFGTNLYLEINKDVKEADVNPLLHYEWSGKSEGRCLTNNLQYQKTKLKINFPFFARNIEKSYLENVQKDVETVAVFASFSANGKIADYVVYYLRELRKSVDAIIFIADNPIFLKELDKIKNFIVHAKCGRHKKYDFGSYQIGMQIAKDNGLLKNAENLIFCNDSCYGPIYPFKEMFDEMESRNVDFWGLTENVAYNNHLQTYFLSFGKKIIQSEVLEQFLDDIKADMTYLYYVRELELKLTPFLEKCGYSYSAFVMFEDLAIKALPNVKTTYNPTRYPLSLMSKRVPLLKTKVITDSDFSYESISGTLGEINKQNPDLLNVIIKNNIKNSILSNKVCNFISFLRKLKKDKRKILLVSHEMTYTGAPQSLLLIAKVFQKMGYEVDVVTLKAGKFAKEFTKLGIKVSVENNLYKMLLKYCFAKYVIVNTIVPYRIYNFFSCIIPTIWFIRENPKSFDKKADIFLSIVNASNLYVMSEYSKNQYLDYNYEIKVIKHGFEDEYRNKTIMPSNLLFAVIGSLEERKAQDIFVEAVRKLPLSLRRKSKFYIIGRALKNTFFEDLMQRIEDLPEIEYLGEIEEHNKILEIYENISCVVVPSREEPTSRVAIEAMMMGRPVIASKNVGAQYLIEEGKNGFVFERENIEQLAACMGTIIANPDILPSMENSARNAFLANNAINVMEKNLQIMLKDADISFAAGCAKKNPKKFLKMLDKTRSKPEVNKNINSLSIIVPIYNALDDVKKLLKSICLSNISQSEITLIDDCSETETKEFLENFVLENSSFTLLRNETNLGFIKTCNRGMKIAKGDVVVLLNSDTIIPNDFENKILECFRSDKNIAFASPISSNTGLFKPSIEINQDNIDEINKKIETVILKEYPFITPEGFCFCCNKNIVEKIGYLDEIFGMGYCEEDDIVLRAISMGYKTVLIDNLLVCHKRHASFSSQRRQEIMEKNNIIFSNRWGNFRDKTRGYFGVFERTKKISRIIDTL